MVSTLLVVELTFHAPLEIQSQMNRWLMLFAIGLRGTSQWYILIQLLATSRVPFLFLTAFSSSVDFDDSFPCPQYCAMQRKVSRQVAFSNLLCGRTCPLNQRQNVNFTFPCCQIRSPRVHLRQIATWPNCISLPGILKMYAQDLRCCLQIVFLANS